MDFESTEQMEAGVKALHNTDLGQIHRQLNLTKSRRRRRTKRTRGCDKFLWFASRRAKFTVDDYRKRLIRFICGSWNCHWASSESLDSGRSKGWATVRFETEEAAQAAIDRFNGTDFGGREVEVRIDRFE